MKLMVRLLSVDGVISAKSSFSSMPPVEVHGDFISLTSLLRGSSTTLLQSNASFSLAGFSRISSITGTGSAASVTIFGSPNPMPSIVLNSCSAGAVTLAPHSLQNLAPSTSLLPQLLQNIITSEYLLPKWAGLTFLHIKNMSFRNYSVKYYYN